MLFEYAYRALPWHLWHEFTSVKDMRDKNMKNTFSESAKSWFEGFLIRWND